ncbi:MAG: hypothetical protein Q9188_006206 [Gyalolechia gomerana]
MVLGKTPSLPQFSTHGHSNPWQALVEETGLDVVLPEVGADVTVVGRLVEEEEEDDEDREVVVDALGGGVLLLVLVTEAELPPPRPKLTHRRPTQPLVGVAEIELELERSGELVMELSGVPVDERLEIDELPAVSVAGPELPPRPKLTQRRPVQPLVDASGGELKLERLRELVVVVRDWTLLRTDVEIVDGPRLLLKPKLKQRRPVQPEAEG